MKTENSFEKFESLLLKKESGQLNEEERDLANQFADNALEYDAMRRVLLECSILAEEIGMQDAPSGGAEQVWSRFKTPQKNAKRIKFYNPRISAYWVVGLSAVLIISWLIRFPVRIKEADPVFMQMNRPVLVQAARTDTIVKEVPVYIQSESAEIAEKSNYSAPAGGMVYFQPVKSVTEQIEQRQGTNANEMGDLAKLTVAVN